MEDFIVDAEGHCFFCLDKRTTKSISGGGGKVQSIAAHSLQYLSRYLKMNRRKIFNDEDSIPPDLLAKVEKSRLTSELCDECGRLNKQFSKLFRNLEMTELRITSCLDRIHKKLLAAEDTGKTEKFSNEAQSEPASNGKRKIAQTLRAEAMDNCFKKLNGITPRVKLRKLNMEQIRKKKLNVKLASHKSRTTQLQWQVPTSEEVNEKFSEEKIKLDGVEGDHHSISNSNQYGDVDDDNGHDMESNDFNETEDGIEAFEDRSLPMASPLDPLNNKISYEGTFTISNSGKYICKDCLKEYSSSIAFQLHYRGNHLNIKFKCAPCGKEFATRAHFNNHQQSVHQHVRFKCDRCDAMYTSKSHLDSHRRSAHFGGRIPCHFCPMTFENFKDRNKHVKVECQSKSGQLNDTNTDND